MTSKLEQAARALLAHWDTPAWKYLKPTGDLMADLREALSQQAEQVKQNPIGWTVASNLVDDGYEHSFTVVSSEPANTTSEPYIPLYATPVRTKDLTDDEILKCDERSHGNTEWTKKKAFARAVIAADRGRINER